MSGGPWEDYAPRQPAAPAPAAPAQDGPWNDYAPAKAAPTDPARPGGEFTLSNIVKGIYNSAVSGATLPRDVYQGKVSTMPTQMTPEEGLRVADMAGLVAPGAPARLVTQAEKSAVFGDARGAATRFAANPEAAAARSAVTDASDLGIGLTAGQRAADPALLSTENAMAGGAYGPGAQKVAQQGVDVQREQILAARDAIGQRAGRGEVVLDRPADAGGLVGNTIEQRGGQAQAELNRMNAAEAARVQAANEAEAARVSQFNAAEEARSAQANEAARQSAQAAAEQAQRRLNPQGVQPVDAGNAVSEGLRQRATQGREQYQGAYRDAFNRDGEIAPGFFRGIATPGRQELTAAGSPLNEFAAPISQRITQDLTNRAEPVIIDRTLTPLASATLNDLDRVASLNLGRNGQPGAGEAIAGVNLRGIEQARKIVTARMRAAAATPEDQRALRGIMDAFDDQLERGFDSVLFSGDDQALGALRNARAQFRDYQQTFRPRGQGDDAGRVIQNIIERDASPEEVANHVLGSSRVGATGTSVRTFTRMQQIFGAESPELEAIRGAAWQKLTGGADAATPRGAQQLSERIREFTTGQGSTLAQRMFSAEDLEGMRAFGDAMQAFARRVPDEPQGLLPRPTPEKAMQGEAMGHIKTLIDVANKRLSPEDTASALFGYGNKVTSANIRLVDAIGSLVGRETPEWAAIRQGIWQRVSGVAEGRTEMGAQKMSERVLEFVNGEGKTLAQRLFSEEELGQMRKLANVLKAVAPKPGTTNPSNSGNRAAALARETLSAIGAAVGASASGPAGAAAGYVVGKGFGAVRNARAAAQARQLYAGQEPISIGRRLVDAGVKIPAAGAPRALGSAATGRITARD